MPELSRWMFLVNNHSRLYAAGLASTAPFFTKVASQGPCNFPICRDTERRYMN